MIKCKCGNNLFYLKNVTCCGKCSENCAYDPISEKYTCDEKIIIEKGLIRNQVEDEGECNFGTAYGGGCIMFICSKCGYEQNLPTNDC